MKYRRSDGWENAITGLGGKRDKRSYGAFVRRANLTDVELEDLFDGDDIAALIVEKLPEDALRLRYTLEYDGDRDDVTDDRRRIEEELGTDGLGATTKLVDALIWGRLFGGGALLIGADDGSEDLTEPLDEEKVSSFNHLTVLEKRDLVPYTWYDDPAEEKFGQVELYHLTPFSTSRSGGGEWDYIHETRLIICEGAKTTLRGRQRNNGWTLSVLQRVIDVIRDFNQAYGSAGLMLQDGSQAIFKLKGLIDMIGTDDEDDLTTRMGLVDMSRSVARAILLDADDEDFQYSDRTFAGVNDVIELFILRLGAAARIPITILFGRAPAGLNATGASDLEIWYGSVTAYQTHVVKPRLERIIRLAASALGIQDPESWSVSFASLWVESPKEKTERGKTQAETDKIYIETQVHEPEEVALARTDGIDAEVNIDEDSRRLMLEMDREKPEEDDDPPTPPFVEEVVIEEED